MHNQVEARILREIQADVVQIRMTLRAKGVPESYLDNIWSLVDEAFRRGYDYAQDERREG